MCTLKGRDDTASETGSTKMVAAHDVSVKIAPPPHVAFLMQIKKIHHGNFCCLNLGKVSFLVFMKMQLLHWISEQREQGLQVTTGLIRKVAEKFLHEFNAKTMSAREQVVRRFMHSVGLTHRIGTHTTQNVIKTWKLQLVISWNLCSTKLPT